MNGDVWALVRERSAEAHASGALYRIRSEPFFVEDGGVEFVVRRAVDYQHQLAIQPKPRPGNPFLEPEPALLIGDVGPAHRALLNKYHVIENHLLVVTRDFVDQSVLLDRADFDALATCMPPAHAAIAFYNGGRESGASQPHKHLQVVTLPLSPHLPIPLAPRLVSDPPRLPFPHGFARLDDFEPGRLYACYRDLLAQVGIRPVMQDGIEHQSQSYNMVIGPGWMLVVPRVRDRFEGVPINSIAFCGALFVRDDRELQAVRDKGPFEILAHVCA